MSFPPEYAEHEKIARALGLHGSLRIEPMTLSFEIRTFVVAITVDQSAETITEEVVESKKVYDEQAKKKVTREVTRQVPVTFVAEHDDRGLDIRQGDRCYGIQAKEVFAKQRVDEETGAMIPLGGKGRVHKVLIASYLRMKGAAYADGKARKMLVLSREGSNVGYALPYDLHSARMRGEFQDVDPQRPPSATYLFCPRTRGQENVPIRDLVSFETWGGATVWMRDVDLKLQGSIEVWLHERIGEMRATRIVRAEVIGAEDGVEVKDAIRAGDEWFPRSTLRTMLNIGPAGNAKDLQRAHEMLPRYEPESYRKELRGRRINETPKHLKNQYEALKTIIGELDKKLQEKAKAQPKAEMPPAPAPLPAELEGFERDGGVGGPKEDAQGGVGGQIDDGAPKTVH